MRNAYGRITRFAAILALMMVAYAGAGLVTTEGASPVSGAWAQQGGTVPGEAIGNSSTSDMWRAIRRGAQGSVSVPDKETGVLIRSEGDNWRAFRNGPMSNFGVWLIAGVLVALLVFFLIRGPVKIDSGLSGRLIERFNNVERFAHWVTASSFVVLGLTGLNMLYGRYAIKPLIGGDAFSTFTMLGKYTHDFMGFAFMFGIVLILLIWVRDNFPNKHDVVWLAKGGGLFSKGVHPPARKFNAGQKMIFWLTVLAGASLSFTGLGLLFPFTIEPFEATFALLNMVGFDYPVTLSPMDEMHYTQMWHGILSLVMIAVILAHIYIGWLGMEGAFDAMGSGFVDENWARQHHSVWMDEMGQDGGGGAGSAPTRKPDA